MDSEQTSLYEAIFLRHSRRKYLRQPIEAATLERIEALAGRLNAEAAGCRIVPVPSHSGAIFSGIRGGYGIIKGAPSYLAFIARPQESGSYARLGYYGETMVLEATRLGLGSCWVSGTFDPRAAGRELDLGPAEELVAVTPLGYPREGTSMSEKLIKRAAGSHSRKPLEQLCTGEPVERWPDWARTAVEAGRLAPSAVNRQPWRFRYDGEELTVETADGGSEAKKLLDCGIALCHLELGARHSLGEGLRLRFYPAPRVGGIRPA
jgi:nitroreductase